MELRQHRQGVGANFVRHVAVGGNTVCPHPHGVHLPFCHQAGGHGVGNQLIRHAQLAQFPCGQPAALQQRTGFIHPDIAHLAFLMHAGNHAQRGTDARRRQPAGVAVGQQTAAGLHQRTARLRNRVAKPFVFVNQAQRFCHQRRNERLLPQRQLHAVEIVHQVDRRRTGGAQGFQRHRQLVAALAVFRQQRQQQACRETNQRRAAHPQGVDVPDQRLHRRGIQPAFLLRKRLLVENKELIIRHPQAGRL